MNALWEKIKGSALIQSVLIVGLCLAVYWIGPISVWESNDDALYNLLFSGQLLTSSPEPHVYFVNFVLSSIFSQLYTLVPHIPWYGYFQVSALLLSVWFLNYCYALAYGTDKIFVRIALSLATLLPFLFFLQFTKTAMVLGGAGFLGLYLLSQGNFNSPRQQKILLAVSVLLLVFSFSLRKESFLLMTLLCGGLMVGLLIKRKREVLVVLAVTTVLILCVTLIHKINYGTEWEHFNNLARVITPIIDYNQYSYEVNQKNYAAAGLSKNDYYFLKNWGHADKKVFSPERLGAILASSTKMAQQRNMTATLQEAVSSPARNYIFTAAGLSLLLLLIYRQQYRHLLLYVIVPFLICAGILIWEGRFPTRVSAGMVFFLPWAVLVLCGEMRQRWLVGVASTVGLIALALPVYGQYRDLSGFINIRQMQNNDLHRLGENLSSPPVTLVTLQDSFPYEGLLPFESPSYLANARFIWLCGMNQSPVQEKQLTDLQIDDLFASISEGKTSYVVLYRGFIGIMKQYIFEHYRKNVNVIPVFNSKTFTVYRISS